MDYINVVSVSGAFKIFWFWDKNVIVLKFYVLVWNCWWHIDIGILWSILNFIAWYTQISTIISMWGNLIKKMDVLICGIRSSLWSYHWVNNTGIERFSSILLFDEQKVSLMKNLILLRLYIYIWWGRSQVMTHFVFPRFRLFLSHISLHN